MSNSSGIQKQVLQLYKSFLVAINCKQMDREAKQRLKTFVKAEFNRNAKIHRKEFEAIEYLIRKGEKQLETLKKSSITDFNIS